MKQFLNPMKLRRPMAWLLAAAMMGQNLPLFAVAEDDPNAGTICGYVAHTHGESCDILQNKLICKLPEGEGHTHDVQKCFRQEQKLICQEEHEHAEACHETVNVQTCPLQEYVAHTHGDACYTQEKVRICTVTEHTHTEQCYPVVVPETTEAVETCEHCGVELVESAVHAEDCLTRCTCGQETHVSPCPLYVAPKTCEHCGVELVENAVHAEDCLTRCTCGQETHVSPCPFYVEPELSFYEKLLAAKTMEEFFQLMNGDVDALMAFTVEELKALKEYVEKTYAAMTEPSQDEQDYYAEILAGFDVLLEEEEPEEEAGLFFTGSGTVTVGSSTIEITDVKSLVEADLALLRWEAMGSADNSAISGTFGDKKYTKFDDIYDAVYDLLLKNYTSEFKHGDKLPTNVNNTEEIWKISGTVTFANDIYKYIDKTLIIVAESGATIQMSAAARFTIGYNTDQATECLAIQGRDGNEGKNRIIIEPTNTTERKESVVNIWGGSFHCAYLTFQNFAFANNTYGYATIQLPQDVDKARFLYMSHSTIQNLKSGYAPGIFCRAFDRTKDANGNLKNMQSRLYIYDSDFTDCVSSTGGYRGGSAIRSFAADCSQLRVEGSRFTRNKHGGNTTSADNSTAAGGGAIYWKSCAGEADIIDCLFTGNTSRGVGGAIYNTGIMRISKCNFTENKSYIGGGAIAVEPPRTGEVYKNIDITKVSGSLTLDSETSISQNFATSNGGGIYFNALQGDNHGTEKIQKFPMTLEINGATISQNTTNGNGGGVAVWLNFKSLKYTTGITISDKSEITNNTASGNGGAIWLSSASDCDCNWDTNKYPEWNQGVTMNGGTLSGNTATNGGAIYIATGMDDLEKPMNFILNNGTVTGNTAGTKANGDVTVSGNGGAAYISKGHFIMNGGSLGAVNKANKAKLGGGVYVSGGNATVTDGNVQYNAATENGGGIYVNSGSVTVSGGSVNNNTAKQDGAGFYVNGGTATVSGGSVETNIATRNGGGMYVTGNAQTTGVTISGIGIISGNRAVDGGGVYLTGGSFTQEGPDTSIEGNTATRNGGGVYLTSITPELESGTISGNTANGNGGGIYIDKKDVTLTPKGNVRITNNTADNKGGGICISGTTGSTDAGFEIDDSEETTGSITMTGNNAAYGGAVCIENGTFDLKNNKITVTGNEADNGGGVAVLSGTFTMTDGSVGTETVPNKAENGGGVYVAGGEAYVNGGMVEGNIANNGGGVYVSNGGFVMSGGKIRKNTGTLSGGGAFVEAGNDQNANVYIFSGVIENNETNGSGGAVSVNGGAGSTIRVQIGVKGDHTKAPEEIEITHTDIYNNSYIHTACPIIQNNTSNKDGGAVFISGNSTTRFDIFCLKEDNNIAGTAENARSNFMKVEGGKVLISASTAAEDNNLSGPGGLDANGNPIQSTTTGFGWIDIEGSIHVTGGQVDILGVMVNPDFFDRITVDVDTAKGDHYSDHRPVAENVVKLTYFENFRRPDGSVTGQYTDYMHQKDTEVTISGNIYSHPGYKIVGWYTKNDQAIEGGTWFNPSDKHTLDENLTIYAIWEVYGYTVKFYPNCDSYGGVEMEKQDFTIYPDEETQIGVALRTNTYTRPGYKFIGWDTKADGTGTDYTNGQAVVNLTKEDGAEVPLYAQWEACNHVNTAIFWTANGNALIGTCECGEKEWTVRLTAENTVYDGKQHGATLVYPQEDETLFSSLEITYKKGEETLTGAPVNAGTYTASITCGGATASVTYTIAKADQTAPAKPEYTPNIGEAQSTLSVKNMPASAQGTDVIYVLEYYSGTNLKTLEEGPYDAEDLENDAVFNLNFALTNYYVYAYYEGNENYNASPRTRADQVYFYQGNVRIEIDACDGISTKLENASGTQGNGVIITLTQDEAYYRTVDFEVEQKTRNGENTADLPAERQAEITVDPNNENVYNLTQIPGDTNCVITISITGMKKQAAVITAVEPGQKFSEISGTAADISRDSAFTACYTITEFDSEAYELPVIKFNPAIPDKTSIIMLTNNQYWKWNTAKNEDGSISLSSFVRMGADGGYTFTEDTTLQFVVDFSRCKTPPTAENLTMTLSIEGKTLTKAGDPGVNVTVPSAISAATVTLKNCSAFELSDSGSGLTKAVTYTYTPHSANASIWEGRNSALVLTPPDNLTADALLKVTEGEYTTIYRKNADKKFIIPLAGMTPGNVTITLESSGFPVDMTTYRFKAQWYVSNSKAGSSPMDGEEVCTAEIEFVKPEQQAPSAKLTTDRTLYERTQDLQVTLEGSNLKNVEVRLYYKKYAENGTYQYEDTVYKNQLEWDEKKPKIQWLIDLQAFEQSGTYCLELTARDGVTIILDNVRYFFILK